MASLNKACIIGYLGSDPEMKYLPAEGTPVCAVSIATNETWKDKEGNKKESTEWHRCVFWGKLAEIAGEYLHKGSQAYVEGRIQTRKYTDKQQIERSVTEIRADKLVMLGDPKSRARHDETGEPTIPPRREASARDYQNAARGEGRHQTPAQARAGVAQMEDDIPF